jgi:hypothetical protein
MGIDILVSARRAREKSPPEATKTLIVGLHGGSFPLSTAVTEGEILVVRNVHTEEEVSCRVIHVGSRVQTGIAEVGIEFIKPAPKFWGISFPPEGWSSSSEEAKGYRPEVAFTPLATRKR